MTTWPGQGPGPGQGSRCRDERGAVTAELALGIPLLIAVSVVLVWMLSVGTAQVRVVDASREAARALARGDDPALAEAVARQIAPEGASVRITVEGDRVAVTTTVRVRPPGGLLGGLRGVTVSERAVAIREDAADATSASLVPPGSGAAP